MYEPPPSVYEGHEPSLGAYARTLAIISAAVLLVALGVLGLLATILGGMFEPREYDAVGYGAVLCAGPLLAGGALIVILQIFRQRTYESVHQAGYAAGCLAIPLPFVLLSACIWGGIEGISGGPFTPNEPLLKESAHYALLAARIALVVVTALCVLLALWLTRLLRRREARRWE